MASLILVDSDILSERHCLRCGHLLGSFILPLYGQIHISCPDCHLPYREIHAPTESDLVHLTVREMDVLREMARGVSNKAIAATLQISQKTVKTHMTHIIMAFDTESRTGAAVRALRLGMI